MSDKWLCHCIAPIVDNLGECLHCHRLGVGNPGARLEGACLRCDEPGTEPIIVADRPFVLCAAHFARTQWHHAR